MGSLTISAKNVDAPTRQYSASKLKIERPTSTRPFQEVYVSPQELKDFLRLEVSKYGIDYDEIYNVINCESGFNLNAYNKSGKSYGVAQFIYPSWQYFNKIRGTQLYYLNPYHQIDMMVWAWGQNKGLQKHWDCYNVLYGNK